MDCMYTSLEHLFACLSVKTRYTETFVILNFNEKPFDFAIFCVTLQKQISRAKIDFLQPVGRQNFANALGQNCIHNLRLRFSHFNPFHFA